MKFEFEKVNMKTFEAILLCFLTWGIPTNSIKSREHKTLLFFCFFKVSYPIRLLVLYHFSNMLKGNFKIHHIQIFFRPFASSFTSIYEKRF
jgi:hypothetical protein